MTLYYWNIYTRSRCPCSCCSSTRLVIFHAAWLLYLSMFETPNPCFHYHKWHNYIIPRYLQNIKKSVNLLHIILILPLYTCTNLGERKEINRLKWAALPFVNKQSLRLLERENRNKAKFVSLSKKQTVQKFMCNGYRPVESPSWDDMKKKVQGGSSHSVKTNPVTEAWLKEERG